MTLPSVKPLRDAWRIALLFTAWCLAASAAESVKPFNIPAGDAETTLKLFTQQSGEQILYPPTRVTGIRTNTVRGDMTPGDALRALLRETELVAVQDRETGAYTIRRASPAQESKNAVSRPAGDRAARVEGGIIKLETFEVMGSKLLNMDIPRSRDDAQPYVIFDREAIDQSGTTNLEEFLKQRLTMNTSKSSASQFASNTTGNVSMVNLRGLGINQTLILIDGHRTASRAALGTPLQSDLNGIPLGAVERIEVLPTTASAIYGGTATGGVVNVILRRDYSGLEVRLNYNNTFSTDSAIRQVDFSGGITLENGRTNLLFSGSYSDANVLRVSDRDFLTRYSAAMIANAGGNYQAINAGINPPLGATTNIRSSNGSNLVLKNGTALNSPITYVPFGYAGNSSDGGAAFVTNAGKYNLLTADEAASGGGRSAYGNAPVVESFMLTARREFTPWLQVFADGFFSRNKGRFPINSGFIATTIQPTAPNNPFQQAVTVRVPVLGNDTMNRVDTESRRFVGGVIVDLPRGWKAEADFGWSRAEDESFAGPALNTSATLGVASGGIDVLRDLNAYRVDWSQYQFPGPFLSYLTPNTSVTKDLTIRASGPVWQLPGGNVQLSGLLEHLTDDFEETIGRQINAAGSVYIVAPSRSQSFDSAYLETTLPFFSAKNRRTGIEDLHLQVGVRHDEYEVNGATSTLTGIGSIPSTAVSRSTTRTDSDNFLVALGYSPLSEVSFRASYGTGFLPPTVNQVLPGTLSQPVSGANLVDLRRGNTSVGSYQVLQGGNPGIRSEESKSWSAGVIFTPTALDGFRASLDYTRIEKDHNITAMTPQQVIDNESVFPDRVTRGPKLPGDPADWAGPITLLNGTLVNLSKAKVEAFDVQLDYSRPTTLGDFSGFFLATWQTSYETQLLPSTPTVENVGIGNFPLDFKGTAGLTWKLQHWTAGWTVQMFDSYLTADPSLASSGPVIQRQGNGGRVPRQYYHNVFLRYRFGGEGAGTWIATVLGNSELTVGVRNIFNEDPPLDAASLTQGYTSGYGDARLASYYVSFLRRF